MSRKPTSASGGLEVKPPTKPEAPATQGVKLEKASDLKEVVEKPNTRYTYAVIRSRRNVVVSVINKNGFIKINIVTMTPQRPTSGFNARLLNKVIRALNDLYNDLTALKPDISTEKKSVREY